MSPHADNHGSPTSRAAAEPAAVPSDLRIVVAEDESLIRMDLVEMLRDEGYRIAGQARNGAEALEIIRQERPDLAILDISMPVMDGLTAAEVIAAEGLCAVLMLTAFSDRQLIQRATAAGVMAYLVKPYQRTDLAPAIEVAVVRYREQRALAAESESLAEQLAARKLIDRAKAKLQNQYGMSEADAFNWIQRAAMDKRTTMRRVAEVVLNEA